MSPFLIVGNWKSNKTVAEAKKWMGQFSASWKQRTLPSVKIVICAPFTVLSTIQEQITSLDLPIEIGAQDVSPFPKGAYTGEVAAAQVKELADWVIIGHSERRAYFHETDEELVFEVEQAKQAGLHVVFCVSDTTMMVPNGVDVLAFEPIASIGTGKNMMAEEAAETLKILKKKTGVSRALYGGSVTSQTIGTYTKTDGIDGVLVGGASLDPTAFFQLITVIS